MIATSSSWTTTMCDWSTRQRVESAPRSAIEVGANSGNVMAPAPPLLDPELNVDRRHADGPAAPADRLACGCQRPTGRARTVVAEPLDAAAVERGVDVARVAIDASLRGVLRHGEAQRREGGTNGAGDVLDDEPPFRPLTADRVPHVASLPSPAATDWDTRARLSPPVPEPRS